MGVATTYAPNSLEPPLSRDHVFEIYWCDKDKNARQFFFIEIIISCFTSSYIMFFRSLLSYNNLSNRLSEKLCTMVEFLFSFCPNLFRWIWQIEYILLCKVSANK